MFFIYFMMFFFFNDTATTEIYTLSLHDALPIFPHLLVGVEPDWPAPLSWPSPGDSVGDSVPKGMTRSEEHTSELQSQSNLVCRLLLEKKKKAPQQVNDRLQLRLDRLH